MHDTDPLLLFPPPPSSLFLLTAGFVDRTARYNIFTNPPSGVQWARMFSNLEAIRITGRFPTAKYFSIVGYPIFGEGEREGGGGGDWSSYRNGACLPVISKSYFLTL